MTFAAPAKVSLATGWLPEGPGLHARIDDPTVGRLAALELLPFERVLLPTRMPLQASRAGCGKLHRGRKYRHRKREAQAGRGTVPVYLRIIRVNAAPLEWLMWPR